VSLDLSIVVVTYNSAVHIGACLASLREYTRGVSYETIVVDNASPDGTAALIAREHPWARLIARTANAGFAAAINEGAAAASGEHIAVINPDTRFEHDALAPLVAHLRAHADGGIVAPKLLDPDGSVQLSCRAFPGYATALFNRYSLLTRLLPRNRYSRAYLMSDFAHDEIRDVDWVSGAAFVMPRAVFERVDGMDAGFFMYSEDVDLCRRVHDAGYRVVYKPTVSLVHEIGGSTRSLPARMVVERHRSMWRYYRKHQRGNPIRDAVTGVAIAARCALLLASHIATRPFVAASRSHPPLRFTERGGRRPG